MGMGRRKRQLQQDLWIATDSLPDVPQHVFYEKLNSLLAEAGFDDFVEKLCRPYYCENVGRGSIPPGVYFRMLFVGYFEGIDSQRGIAWRCADSRSLARFLGFGPKEATPDHSSLTRIRNRLPLDVYNEVFCFMLQLADDRQLLKGKTVAIDATTLEANAAMKSIVRQETGEDWKAYVTRLMKEEGATDNDEPTDEEIRRYDKARKNKKVSNEHWQSPSDPDSRIMKMKDGRTHLAYKAEHAIDLESDLLLAAEVYHANEADTATLLTTVNAAQQNLDGAETYRDVEEVVADKGYHSAEVLADCYEWSASGLRTYICEPKRKTRWNWQERSWSQQQAVCGNHRRMKGNRGKRLQKQRSERAERSFAHMCDTGGARRSWLRGLNKVKKRYTAVAAARNPGVLMRKLFGIGKPRALQGVCWLVYFFQLTMHATRNVLRQFENDPATRTPRQRNEQPLAIPA